MFVCVCVCERERENETWKKKRGDRLTERKEREIGKDRARSE